MKKWICIGLFLIGTCSVQAQDLVSDFLAKTKENKVFTQVNISSRMFQMISEITDAETESIIRNLTGMKMLTTEQETDRYFQEVRTMLQKRKPEYEELMSILEEGEQGDCRIGDIGRRKGRVYVDELLWGDRFEKNLPFG